MKRKSKILSVVLTVVMAVTMLPFMASAAETDLSDNIVVLYSSDINGNISGNIGISGMVAYANEMKTTNKYVEMVDVGNAAGGTVLAGISKGEYVVKAMNIAGYGIAVPGSYEFSYGVKQLTNLSSAADFNYVSCNFTTSEDAQTIFEPYKIVTYGDTKVAYIGISDPDIMTQHESYFKNSDGSYAYSLSDGNRGNDLYTQIQAAIVQAKEEGADYIVALGNLRNTTDEAFTAQAIIENTSGINAFINSNSGKASAGEQVKDSSGNDVLLTSPGSEISSIGVLTISVGKSISSQLISSYKLRDINTKNSIDALTKEYSTSLNEEFAVTSSKLEASSVSGVKTVESGETNLGDLCADAYRAITGADIAFVEASEIAANISVGKISYNDVIRVLPEDKSISVAQVSGFDILDALEMSSRLYPDQNSNFLQVSGVTFDIQETVIPSVFIDSMGNFVSVEDDYRVTNVMINGKALDLMETYTVAGTNDLLNGKTGYTMLTNGPLTKVNVATGNLALITYIDGKLGGAIGGAYSKSQGRIDSIKLARQSAIDAQIEEKVEEKVKDYKAQMEELQEELDNQKQIVSIKTMTIKASSKFSKSSSGKRSMKISWTPSVNVSGIKYQVYKSSKKSSGYKKMLTTSKKTYTNTSGLTKGKTYYYKVRAYKYIDGKYYYSAWSNIAYRKVSK